MNRLDDLTILLNLVDKTKAGFSAVQGRMTKLQKASALLRKTFIGLGAALKATFVAGVANGSRLTDELVTMARQINLTLRETQALFLAVSEADGSANLDNLTEAALTLKERFADAATGAGPLFNLMNDFQGFNLNLGVDNVTQQLANFLEQVGKLPTANDRIFALKEVLGDEDARPFFNVINNTEKLNALIVDLRRNIEDVPDLFSAEDEARIISVKAQSGALAREWKILSVELFALFAPLVELSQLLAEQLVKFARFTVGGLENLRDGLARLIGRDPLGDAVELTENAAERIAAGSIADRTPRVEDVPVADRPVINEYGAFQNIAAFDRFLTEQKRDIERLRDLDPIEAAPRPEVLSLEDGRRDRLFLADSLRDKEAEHAELMADLAQQQTDQIMGISSALGSAGAAFGQFARLAGSNSQKAFKQFQKLQIAMSLAAGIAAQIGVLASGDLPLFSQKLAAFFKIGALVASGLASLRSINLGSSSASARNTTGAAVPSGGGNQSSAVSALAQDRTEQGPRSNITINIRGDARYTADHVEELIDAINTHDTGRLISANKVSA